MVERLERRLLMAAGEIDPTFGVNEICVAVAHVPSVISSIALDFRAAAEGPRRRR